jgi:hypothetical protein
MTARFYPFECDNRAVIDRAYSKEGIALYFFFAW